MLQSKYTVPPSRTYELRSATGNIVVYVEVAVRRRCPDPVENIRGLKRLSLPILLVVGGAVPPVSREKSTSSAARRRSSARVASMTNEAATGIQDSGQMLFWSPGNDKAASE